jgi:putative ABC transport system permease protein
MVAVVSISASSRARLNQQLAALGTNMLTATESQSVFGDPTPLPVDAIGRIERIDGVESASTTARLDHVSVFRNNMIDRGLTAGITVQAADLGLLEVVSGGIATGNWLNRATATYPTVVLGSDGSVARTSPC